jgi:hypothetical protein
MYFTDLLTFLQKNNQKIIQCVLDNLNNIKLNIESLNLLSKLKNKNVNENFNILWQKVIPFTNNIEEYKNIEHIDVLFKLNNNSIKQVAYILSDFDNINKINETNRDNLLKTINTFFTKYYDNYCKSYNDLNLNLKQIYHLFNYILHNKNLDKNIYNIILTTKY